ncbi:MAG TPA: tetratricopeptide repeat protein, partial [Solirubrobacterales bacterium]|nr:tetratricopeptide repeat protein [Solirubrobacterales bacterium]
VWCWTPGRAAIEETIRLAEESGDLNLQVAIRAASSYAYICAGDFAGHERALDEMIELSGGDPSVGAGIILHSPLAWAEMGKGMVRRESGDLDAAGEYFERALRMALDGDDSETASWIRSNQVGLLAMRGEAEAALALARRNCELTERIGDVFSRSLARAHLAWAQIAVEEFEQGLESIEEADQIYREAMKVGGEMEGWRSQIRTKALIGLGRVEEAIEEAEWAVGVSRERGLGWSLPLALLALAQALNAGGRDGATEALDESERVARETGALVCLDEIEAEREAVGSGAER